MTFKDHFSATSAEYARVRPVAPAAMIAWLAELCSRRDAAWDAGTGNGQTARLLAPWFRRVVATDASAAQLAQAEQVQNIHYIHSLAEASGLRPHSIDLLTSSQAIHWFDIPAFMREAARVLRPGGVIAVWTYSLARMGPPYDRLLAHFERAVHDHWPPERAIVERRLRGIPFPFQIIPPPRFAMTAAMNLDQLRAYLDTWSASQNYRAAHGRSPLAEIDFPLRAAWGPPETAHRLTWPLHIRAGRVV